MRKLFLMLAISSSVFADVAVQVNTDNNDDNDQYYTVDTWYGPGWYYGFYFESDYDYWNWRHNNPNWWDYHHRYYHGHDNHYHGGSPREGGEHMDQIRGGDQFRGGGGRGMGGGGHGGGHGR